MYVIKQSRLVSNRPVLGQRSKSRQGRPVQNKNQFGFQTLTVFDNSCLLRKKCIWFILIQLLLFVNPNYRFLICFDAFLEINVQDMIQPKTKAKKPDWPKLQDLQVTSDYLSVIAINLI